MINEVRASDFILAYTILRDIGIPWDETKAFELGILDKEGKKLKSPITPEEREAYSSYNKIVYNLKRLMQKMVGKNNISQKIARFYLLKESFPEKTVDTVLKELIFTESDENLSEEYIKTFIEVHTYD